jgi:hypothetical protein
LQTAQEGEPGSLPTADECDALDSQHHRKWSDAHRKHVAANRLIVQHRVQSLTVSHQARRKAIEDQVARAMDDRIRAMKESELARADADVQRRMVELDRASSSGDIRATPVLFGSLTITKESIR